MLYFSKLKIISVLIFTIIISFFAITNFIKTDNDLFKRNINLGLDLQGGSYLLLEIDSNPLIKEKIQCQIYDQNKICIDFNKLSEGIEIICIIHIKGLKFLKQNYYCDCYISQIKVFLDGINKYSILDTYSFNDKEEEEEELKELEKDLMLNEEYIQSLKNKEEEENEIKSKLLEAENNLKLQQELIDTLKLKLSEI